MPQPKLVDIIGIGPAAARQLKESGFTGVGSIVASSEEELAKVPGFGLARAAAVIGAARALVAEALDDSGTPAPFALDADRKSESKSAEELAASRKVEKEGKKKHKKKKRKKKRGKKSRQRQHGGKGEGKAKGKGRGKKKKKKKKKKQDKKKRRK